MLDYVDKVYISFCNFEKTPITKQNMAKKTAAKKPTSKSKSGTKGSKKSFFGKLWRFFYVSILAFLVLSILWVVTYKYIDPPYTFLMCKRKISKIIEGQNSNIHYNFVPYNKISNHLKIAIIASEDQKFPIHRGFDFVSIAKAMEKNKFSKKTKGASTISQQTAKNAFLWDGRNFIRKGFEVYFTFLIELVWGKKRILEVYLNICEMGNLTFGAEAASQKFFNVPARKLTASEAALIACSLPNPIIFKTNNPTNFMYKRQSWILLQMQNLGGKSYLKDLD